MCVSLNTLTLYPNFLSFNCNTGATKIRSLHDKVVSVQRMQKPGLMSGLLRLELLPQSENGPKIAQRTEEIELKFGRAPGNTLR